MITVGIVDYYISEWHANHSAEVFEKANKITGLDCQIKYAYAEKYISEFDGKNTDEWCSEYGVTKCDTIAELCQKCDAVMILAPSNPETHLKYAKEVFKWKKPTFIDKTFVDNYAEAKEAFEAAEKYGAKFFSTSSLRFADENKLYSGANKLVVYGNYTNYPEYAVHHLERAISVIGAKPIALKTERQGEHLFTTLKFEGDREAAIVATHMTPDAFAMDEGEKRLYNEIKSDFFLNQGVVMSRFFATGEIPFDTNETLYIMKARDAALAAYDNPGVWYEI